MMTSDRLSSARSRSAFLSTPVWLWLSLVAASLAALGSVLALAVERVYAALTPYFLSQALAQDAANLAFAAPALIILAVLALRGSLRAYLAWLGVVIFTVYNYVIYTFSVPFGPLFFLWVAVFGVCLYVLIGSVTSTDHEVVRSAFKSRRAVVVAAWALVVTAVLIGFLWLSEDVPAFLSGATPQSLIDMALPTNPVHILDLAFFLPAAILTSGMLLKQKSLGYTLAPAFIVFLIFTVIPILLTPVLQAARGETAAWEVVLPIGVLSLALLALLSWLLKTVRLAG